jgi:hypothetical protein
MNKTIFLILVNVSMIGYSQIKEVPVLRPDISSLKPPNHYYDRRLTFVRYFLNGEEFSQENTFILWKKIKTVKIERSDTAKIMFETYSGYWRYRTLDEILSKSDQYNKIVSDSMINRKFFINGKQIKSSSGIRIDYSYNPTIDIIPSYKSPSSNSKSAFVDIKIWTSKKEKRRFNKNKFNMIIR